MFRNPLLRKDFYKADHRRQYPHNTTEVYSNGTFRTTRMQGIEGIVFFGLQYFILKFLIEDFNTNFFKQPLQKVLKQYTRIMDNALGKGAIPTDHIESLHKLGYLPIRIKALPEGTVVPLRVPAFTITNTRDEEFWLVNFLETILSCYIWKPCTSATTAFEFRKVFERYYRETVGSPEGSAAVLFQGHDFSARGMSFEDDAMMSAMGHLLSFHGTDTVWAIEGIENYYLTGNPDENPPFFIGGSVPATEHSVMCMGGEDDELETVRRLITELYPTGIVSIVWDTWDYWGGILNTLSTLKAEIMARKGKLMIRPDSGDPYRIIVGYFEHEIARVSGKIFKINKNGEFNSDTDEIQEHEVKGSIECLWDIFGGSTTAEGYRQLSNNIGLIYGDSITLERQLLILEGLKRKGFASTNVVLGIGSFSYEYVTRDTHGFAMKATFGVVNGEDREIFKNPKTDDGTKRSAKGLVRVDYDEERNIALYDQQTREQEKEGLLQTVFENGKLVNPQSFATIRMRLAQNL